MRSVWLELRRIRDGSDVSPVLEDVLALLAEEFVALGEERSDVEHEDEAIVCMRRAGGVTGQSRTANPDRKSPIDS